MSRQELAEAVNNYLWHTHRRRVALDAGYIGKLERGDHRWPSAGYREALRSVLGVDRDSDLGFFITRGLRGQGADLLLQADIGNQAGGNDVSDVAMHDEIADTGEMKRRELLRLISMTGALLYASPDDRAIDWERVSSVGHGRHPLDLAAVEELSAVNARLWVAFGEAEVKAGVMPVAEQQLTSLMASLRRPHRQKVHKRLCAVTADLLQLAGEIAFDTCRYVDAAHCYSLAASASREAAAYDLWACAMTRHAFISLYEHEPHQAVPMLDVAASLAVRGDSALSTRHWVQAVRAQALAGLGDLDGCQDALDAADEVHRLAGPVQNGGWLRFDGSRLAEERGTCYVELKRPEKAEPVLRTALSQRLSPRRRGAALTDLAMVGVQQRDVHKIVMYGDAALDIARHSGSGVVGSKLQGLRRHLGPFVSDSHVRYLDAEIKALAGAAATN
ncbi:transcriptional regulator [Planosporangium sp. 12N6]|uniref:transcriptional regulator n=1 Tax=Planosporangium spinosum TaxID=3402278 RepID=UPI003CE757B9